MIRYFLEVLKIYLKKVIATQLLILGQARFYYDMDSVSTDTGVELSIQ